MSNDLNRCEFIGRLGKDVETRYMTDGKAVANFSIAVGSSWKSKDGEKQESTEWINLVAYDKLAEICSQYLTKGSQVYVSGKMKTRKWQDKEGKDRYTTEIIVNELQMIGGKQDGGQAVNTPPDKTEKPYQQAAGGDELESDLPFQHIKTKDKNDNQN